MSELDYYKILGVPRGASTSQIKARYQLLAKKIHPDHDGDNTLMELINEAYRVLSNPSTRFHYDKRAESDTKSNQGHEQSTHKTAQPEDNFSSIFEVKERSKSTSKPSDLPVIILSCIVVFIILVAIGAKMSSHKSNDVNAQLASLYNRYQSTSQQFSSLPSTTTQSQSDWDSFFGNTSSQIQQIQSSVNQIIPATNNSENTFVQEFKKTLSDFNGVVTLEKSGTDLQFQVQNDQGSINTDNSTILAYEGDDNVDGAPIMEGEIASEEATLSTDKATLQKDQQSLSNQQSQSAILTKTIASDNQQLKSDATTYGVR